MFRVLIEVAVLANALGGLALLATRHLYRHGRPPMPSLRRPETHAEVVARIKKENAELDALAAAEEGPPPPGGLRPSTSTISAIDRFAAVDFPSAAEIPPRQPGMGPTGPAVSVDYPAYGRGSTGPTGVVASPGVTGATGATGVTGPALWVPPPLRRARSAVVPLQLNADGTLAPAPERPDRTENP